MVIVMATEECGYTTRTGNRCLAKSRLGGLCNKHYTIMLQRRYEKGDDEVSYEEVTYEY